MKKDALFWDKSSDGETHLLCEGKWRLVYGAVRKNGFMWRAIVRLAHADAEFETLREAKMFVDKLVRRHRTSTHE